MPNSTQRYRDYIFSATGRPQYGEATTYEKEAPGGRVVRRRVKYTLTQWFLEPSFADNMSRYQALRAALAVPEGVLLIQDENGTTLVNRRVTVCDHALPEQWSANLTEVKVGFECWEEITADVFDATFTPTGGSAVTLPKVDDWHERIDAERYSRLVPNRRESWQTISAKGSLRANPDHTPAQRLATLQAAAAALRACDAKEGTLTFGDFTAVMRIDVIDAPIADGGDVLRWTLAASRLRFPAGNYAEAAFTVKQADNVQASERLTTVAGEIRAYDAAGAEAKRDAIAGAFATGRALLAKAWDKKVLNGTDGEADAREWVFSFTYREILPGAVASYTLNVQDRTDFASGLIASTYSGTVTAADSAAALAKAAELGAGKYPMPTGSDLQVGALSSGGSAEQFTQVTFSYGYLRRGSAKHAEVTAETSTQAFGTTTLTVSGTAAADTEANARVFARTFKPSGLLVDEREGAATAYHGTAPDSLFQKVTFSYTVQYAPLSGTLDYGVNTVEDFDAYTTTVRVRGVARAASAAFADVLINAALVGLPGVRMLNDRTPNYRAGDGGTIYTQTDFAISHLAPLSAGDNDILLAEYAVEKVFSNNRTVLTPIPYGSPHVQSNVGIEPGMLTVSGSVTSLGATTGQTWARGLRSNGSGGYPMAPREKLTRRYLPRSTSQVRCHVLEFSYPFAFTSLPLA